MGVGSVKPTVKAIGPYANTEHPIVSGRQTTDIPRERDNTQALEVALLKVHNQFAHITVPDDGSGASSGKGSFNPSSLADPAVTGFPA